MIPQKNFDSVVVSIYLHELTQRCCYVQGVVYKTKYSDEFAYAVAIHAIAGNPLAGDYATYKSINSLRVGIGEVRALACEDVGEAVGYVDVETLRLNYRDTPKRPKAACEFSEREAGVLIAGARFIQRTIEQGDKVVEMDEIMDDDIRSEEIERLIDRLQFPAEVGG